MGLIEEMTDAELEQAIYEAISEQLGKRIREKLLKERQRRNQE